MVVIAAKGSKLRPPFHDLCRGDDIYVLVPRYRVVQL